MKAVELELARQALQKVADAAHGPQTTLQLVKLLRGVREKLQDYTEAAQKLAKQHGLEPGQKVSGEVLEEFAIIDQTEVSIEGLTPLSWAVLEKWAKDRAGAANVVAVLADAGLCELPVDAQ